jgi:hypothetical protein
MMSRKFEVQKYWVFELRPWSGTLETRKHNVSETGSVSVLRLGGKLAVDLHHKLTQYHSKPPHR